MQIFEYEIDTVCQKKRLDVFLSEVQEEVSRSLVKKLIEAGQVKVNGLPGKPGYRLRLGDRVELVIPDPAPADIVPEPIPLQIVYEDADLLVVDKPPGMVVHPAPGHSSGTLVNALLHHCGDLAGVGGVERPGIVHRLDKDTSGLVVVAKSGPVLQALADQFKNREVRKVYLAFVKGEMVHSAGLIDAPIGRHPVQRKKMSANGGRGREAQTRYEVIGTFGGFSFVRLFPRTGRTHQIRVHLASIGYPIAGDILYGGKIPDRGPPMPRQALHAHRLELRHPMSEKACCFESPLPADMAGFWQKIQSS